MTSGADRAGSTARFAHFSDKERTLLLKIKGVGPVVIARLEEAGITSLGALAREEPGALSARIAAMLGRACWRNSPMALAAPRAISSQPESADGSEIAANQKDRAVFMIQFDRKPL